ncbi:hypothetical protein ASD31_22830 [Rhizobium sp. Root482]|nr:hypothetical protein ASD31_22830 [Rhizobium sp. Root482]
MTLFDEHIPQLLGAVGLNHVGGMIKYSAKRALQGIGQAHRATVEANRLLPETLEGVWTTEMGAQSRR